MGNKVLKKWNRLGDLSPRMEVAPVWLEAGWRGVDWLPERYTKEFAPVIERETGAKVISFQEVPVKLLGFVCVCGTAASFAKPTEKC